MNKKSPDAFRTISEVSEWLETPAHVLRFWESRFTQVKPVKRAGGRRYYRPADVQLLGGIRKLLHDDGLTIRGVQKIIRDQGVKHVASLAAPLAGAATVIEGVAAELTAEAEAPMIENAEPQPTDNVVALKSAPPALDDAAPPPLVTPAPEATAKPEPEQDRVAEPEFEPEPEPEFKLEPEPEPEPAVVPLGADLAGEDPADDALPLGAAPLSARLRDHAVRRHLRQHHAGLVAAALARLIDMKKRRSDGG